MSKKHHPNNQISITDLIGDAVENAIARREQNLTPEEAKQIKGGTTLGGIRIKPPITLGIIIKPPIILGIISTEPIKSIKF